MSEEEIFQDAAVLSGEDRITFLLMVCDGRPAVRARVERLLASHDNVAFMQRAAARPINAEAAAELAKSLPEGCGERVGNYKLLEEIGEGGCGVVYMAQQEQPVRRTVALKIIKLGMDTRSMIARFEQERQALAMMDHPNIAKVLDAGATPHGRPFFVMELVRGVRVTEFCRENNISVSERVRLFVIICQAIQHAHQKGIIHRDIKPSNILVTLHDGVPVPKVIDFGIAKATTGQSLTDKTLFTAFQQFVGTPAYMSPEQAEMSGLDVDTRSDIYSLGVLLYELLTGQTPFDGQELIASGVDRMRKTIREKEPPRPSTKLTQNLRGEVGKSDSRIKTSKSEIPDDLDWIVMKCLEKDRSRRYDTANDVGADLHRHLNNEPIMARPPSTVYKLRKACRRNRFAFTAAGAVALALVLGITLAIWQAFIAQDQRDKARTAQVKAQKAEQSAIGARQQEEVEKLTAQHHLYIANLNWLGQAWEQNNYQRVHQLLEETRGFPDRGFEWYYWQRQTHLNLKTLRGHIGRVLSVAFSPDGKRLVTGGSDRSVRIWDLVSDTELFRLMGHKSGITFAAFSPDGQRIVSSSYDSTVRFWDAKTGGELSLLNPNQGPVHSAALSRDGRRMVTGGEDGTAKIWDLVSGELIVTLAGHTGTVSCVAFSPDGARVLTGSLDKTVRIWETESGKVLHVIGHSREVYAVVFSPDGQRIITGASHPEARMWNAATGDPLPLSLMGHGTMTDLAVSSDGKHIVSGSWDSTAQLWNADTGESEQKFLGHVKGIFSVAISPDGTLIATAANEGGLKIWDAGGDREAWKVDGSTNEVLAVAISPDGGRIATAQGILDDEGAVRGSGDQAAQVWDAKSKKKLLILEGHTQGVSSIAFSPKGGQILTGSGDCTAKLWNSANGKQLRTLIGHSSSIRSVAFFPDGARLVTGSQDQTARVWETATGQELFKLFGHIHAVSSVAVSPDGKWILAGSIDGIVIVWDAATGRREREIETKLERISSVAFSPDSRWILAGGWGNEPTLWDLHDAKREPIRLQGHSNIISSGAFSPDGKRIVTGSFDMTARVWEAASGRELLRLSGHNYPIYSVAFSRDGQRIITSSHDRTVRIWEAAGLDQVTAWEAEEKHSASQSPE